VLYLLFHRWLPRKVLLGLLEDFLIFGDTALSSDLLCCRWYEFWTPHSCGYAKKFGLLASLSPEINLLFGRLLALLEFHLILVFRMWRRKLLFTARHLVVIISNVLWLIKNVV
jgi:hypothetical protein